jgi:hypothetical protein
VDSGVARPLEGTEVRPKMMNQRTPILTQEKTQLHFTVAVIEADFIAIDFLIPF